MKKKICVVTGSRAEYGLLYPLLTLLKSEPAFLLQLVVTGAHLSPEFGLTYKQIEEDGFEITKKLEILLSSDSEIGITKTIGIAQMAFSDVFADLAPDLLVVLGDRYEILPAVVGALVFRVPVPAHIHGGEITEGAIDNSIRHAITKMSHLHFTSTEEYRRRVTQMGEMPTDVYNVGALGIDNIKNTMLLDRRETEKRLGTSFAQKNLLVTFHPATLDEKNTKEQFDELLSVFRELTDTKIFFTAANADTSGRIINNMIAGFVEAYPERASFFNSMGRVLYLSTMQYVDAVVGNSSSGIIEAPSLHIPTLNVGDRQAGRIQANSIVNCLPEKKAILAGIAEIYSSTFQERIRGAKNPYGEGDSAIKIVQALKVRIGSLSLIKKFNDICER